MIDPAAPRVFCTVCIANYNGEALLEGCLESVLSQQLGHTFEVIVHDDASTDRSLEVLARYPSVRVIASAENVGFCVSNNRMVEASRGEYILLLNNDAALLPGALAALATAALETTPGSVLTLPQFDWDSGDLVDRGCLLDPFMNPIPNTDATTEVAMVIGACLWTSRVLWDELGGFPSWIGSLAEDMYLCCAARQAGRTVRCVAASGYRHMQGRSFGGNRVQHGRLESTYRRRSLSERNKTYLLAVFTPFPYAVPALIAHVATLIAEGLLMSILRRSIRPWTEIYGAALASCWRQRGMLKRTRRQVQARRVVSASRYFSAFRWRLRKLDMLRRHGVPDLR
ncbi:glycosyltransferase [Luteibacter sp. 329MFSha]|uniref:glycosyltransferase family 2 protein n=1 Tax=Luteibacter sp. 329MFSha TaxID=1798239 RepID=UPI0008B29C87|nr:glycosyltransferase [Luteibacter sp. 329MFSha]SEW01844.1 Glycosyltransferase, GT2 family [Luteibacter sp. 329MFSha]